MCAVYYKSGYFLGDIIQNFRFYKDIFLFIY